MNKKIENHFFAPIFAVISMGATSGAALADEHSVYEFTPRLNIVAGNGKPANDIPGIGLAIHRKMNNEWYLGINIDHSPLFDFEDTAGLVDDLDQDGIVDADSTHTMITVVGERRYAMDSPGWTVFWNLGGGINEVDVDDVDGPLKGGGTYDIETDVDTELILIGHVGWIQRLGDTWSARYEITAEYHKGDWEMTDKISGNTGDIEDYMVYGLRLGLTYR